jgi:hypothetical protein
LAARLDRQNRILIPVRVNGGPQLWCLFDTGGARSLYLSHKEAAELGMAPSFTGQSAGPMDSALRADSRALVTLDAGGVHLTRQELVIKDGLGPSDGVIGAAVFANFVIEIDFQTPAVRFHSTASFRYQGSGCTVPFDLWSNNPHIVGRLTVGDLGPIEARMTVDTGAGGGPAYVTPKFNDELRRKGCNLPWVPDQNGFSTCQIECITVGRFAMERPVVHLLPSQGFGNDPTAPDAVLAVEFLRRYRIFLDYAKRQMILEPISMHEAVA